MLSLTVDVYATDADTAEVKGLKLLVPGLLVCEALLKDIQVICVIKEP